MSCTRRAATQDKGSSPPTVSPPRPSGPASGPSTMRMTLQRRWGSCFKTPLSDDLADGYPFPSLVLAPLSSFLPAPPCCSPLSSSHFEELPFSMPRPASFPCRFPLSWCRCTETLGMLDVIPTTSICWSSVVVFHGNGGRGAGDFLDGDRQRLPRTTCTPRDASLPSPMQAASQAAATLAANLVSTVWDILDLRVIKPSQRAGEFP